MLIAGLTRTVLSCFVVPAGHGGYSVSACRRMLFIFFRLKAERCVADLSLLGHPKYCDITNIRHIRKRKAAIFREEEGILFIGMEKIVATDED